MIGDQFSIFSLELFFLLVWHMLGVWKFAYF